MLRSTRRFRASLLLVGLLMTLLLAPAIRAADAPATAKAPPERTYSDSPFVHRIVVLDEDGAVIRPTKPGEEAAPNVSTKPMSQAQTCGKCHSDYPLMQQGWHFNSSRADAPHGRPGEPWILTDVQTRTQLPLSYRGWQGTFHPHDVGINDFQFARLFGRHHPGGGALQTSGDLRMKMSGPLENDCLICHTSDDRYDPAARAVAIATDQNFKYAPTLASFLGKVQGQASRLRDNFDPAGPDARRAPKVNYDPARFDDLGNVVFNVARRVSNERCYFCHTNIDVGRPSDPKTNVNLESRWRHDRDIHLAKGMSCVDCHRNGPDHMMVRGYEGEFDDRAAIAGAKPDPTITTLSCAGCHYGTDNASGGRNAAPRPLHKGLPTLHFDKLSCTACHSGPAPADATTLVQTAMAHKLGLPRHHTVDAAAPTIQQPVFLRVDKRGLPIDEEAEGAKIAPHRMIFPSFWGRMTGEKITPIPPEQVIAAGVESILGEKPSDKEFQAIVPLTEEQIAQVLEKLAAAPPSTIKPADAVSARSPAAPATVPTTATTAPTTAATPPAPPVQSAPPPAWATGEPVFVTGMKVYKRGASGKIESFFNLAAAPYAWPLGHDVRGAQQSLGARGCVECHASGAPIFNAKVDIASVVTGAGMTRTMAEARMESTSALSAFAATYPLRWLLVLIGYASAAILLLVILTRAVQILSRGATR
ncbi:MAG: hypothetical protein QOE14_2109 [Humisphaera sp.]|nr:hypothetical protein [Humisphaera sp.]